MLSSSVASTSISPFTPRKPAEFVARGIATAIDGPVRVVGQRRGVGLKPEFDVGHGEKAPDNRLKGDARIEMGLARKIQRAGKTTRQIGLKLGDAVGADLFKFPRASGKEIKLRLVPRRGDDKAAATLRHGNGLGPIGQRLHAEVSDQRLS